MEFEHMLNNIEHSLKWDELFNMRPKQAANLASGTFLNESQSLLARLTVAKTDEERKYISKNFALQAAIAGSVIALNYAQKANVENNTKNWYFGGVLWSGQSVSNSINQLSYKAKKALYDKTFDFYVGNLELHHTAQGLRARSIMNLLHTFDSRANIFSRMLFNRVKNPNRNAQI